MKRSSYSNTGSSKFLKKILMTKGMITTVSCGSSEIPTPKNLGPCYTLHTPVILFLDIRSQTTQNRRSCHTMKRSTMLSTIVATSSGFTARQRDQIPTNLVCASTTLCLHFRCQIFYAIYVVAYLSLSLRTLRRKLTMESGQRLQVDPLKRKQWLTIFDESGH